MMVSYALRVPPLCQGSYLQDPVGFYGALLSRTSVFVADLIDMISYGLPFCWPVTDAAKVL